MNYINFESAKKIEKERLVLKQAREEILLKAKKNACKQPGSESEHTLNEQNWMLPTVARKLSLAGKKHKQKKLKKSKKKRDSSKLKKKKKRQRRDSSGSSNSSSENELVSGSSTESSSNEDVKERRRRKKIKNTLLKQQTISSDEKVNTVFKDEEKDEHNAIATSFDRCNNSEKHTMTRDSWMTNNTFTLKTFSRDHIAKKPPKVEETPSKYDPTRSDRELNPFWKTTGTGLPKFKKPIQGGSDQEDTEANKQLARDYTTRKRNWKKEAASCENEGSALRFSRLHSDSRASSSASENDESVSESSRFFTDQEMNVLGAKLIKAEIMGNSDLVLELKHKLECARQSREKSVEPSRNTEIYKRNKKVEHILLTHTDKHGNNRPLPNIHNEVNKLDFDKHPNGKQNKKTERLGTHIDGKRVRYFVDDDKYDIKKMFEREKYVSSADTNMEFANLACKHNNMNDDIDDIFVDKIRQSKTGSQTKKSEKLRAMHEQSRLNEQLDNCYKCLDSMKMDKKLIVSIGEKVYLALPWHKGLQTGHCIITTTQHVSCSTQTDEDTWSEINEFRKALVRMFATQRKDVIFFEVANKFHKNPHLEIHCVPIPEQKAELAPFYFKKAIEESELEWSVNKQLISLSKKPLRNSVPKGLPYFWVSFGLNDGFAHVIEDQDRFPSNFAMEIIGGMLHLESNTWRHPRKEQNIIDKVKIFGNWWEKYDCTVLT